jgi:hypothetical protein
MSSGRTNRRASAVATSAAMSDTSAPRDRAETDAIKWAWAASPGGPKTVTKQAVLDANPAMKDDLLDVVRLLSTTAAETQTVEPSFTKTLRSVHMEGDDHRSIAVQAGHRSGHNHATTQVTESDVAEFVGVEAWDEDGIGLPPGQGRADDPLHTGHLPPKAMHSSHHPHCGIDSEQYPVYLADARALGVCNRYGFLSLPKSPMELPPRRRVKAMSPVDYPHLYGRHQLGLDEGVSNRLSRAHNLWIQSSGFVPKF